MNVTISINTSDWREFADIEEANDARREAIAAINAKHDAIADAIGERLDAGLCTRAEARVAFDDNEARRRAALQAVRL